MHHRHADVAESVGHYNAIAATSAISGPPFTDFFVASKAMTFVLYGNVLTRCKYAN